MEDFSFVQIKGKIIQIGSTIIKASVPGVKIGELSILKNPWEQAELIAEMVELSQQVTILTLIGDIHSVSSTTEVTPTGKVHMVPVGDNLLGRLIDDLGRLIDGDKKDPSRPHILIRLTAIRQIRC
jgi:type III secretion protein N (ATPase)